MRPLAPPKADPFHTRPVTSWNGRVEISAPDGATPIMIDSPQPRWQHSSACRIVCMLPMHSNEKSGSASHINNRLNDFVAADFVRVDEMRHAELLSHLHLGGIEVDPNDLVGPDHACSLDYIQSDATKSEDGRHSRPARLWRVQTTARRCQSSRRSRCSRSCRRARPRGPGSPRSRAAPCSSRKSSNPCSETLRCPRMRTATCCPASGPDPGSRGSRCRI